ncbi:MAG: C25 family cysteine peptidase [Bacteroidales bacterium]
MNSFCEECGNKLAPDDKFCQECGTPVPVNVNQDTDKVESNYTYSFFQSKRGNYIADKNYKFGILFTNFKKFGQQFGPNELEELKQHISEYLESVKSFGTYYLVLDASDNYIKTVTDKDWKHHVGLLGKSIKKVKERLDVRVSYVLLFGGTEIIPMPVFLNPLQNSNDKDVDSDLPYSTLSIANPMDKQDARTPLVPTGRIPTGVNTTLNDLCVLLGNTLEGMANFSTQKTFGLSTYSWREVSNAINTSVCKDSLYVSPGLTIQNVHEHYADDSMVHYFNLHGSDRAPDWYGQKDDNLPVAFSPSVIARNRKHNIIGVEACYGARFIGLKKDESVLLSAMANKTISFVGSSRVAWGPSAPPINLADIVIHDYLDLMQSGVPAGEAFRRARMHAFANSKDNDPSTSLLTMMEFNLFGDPSFIINDSNGKSALAKGVSGQLLGIDGDSLKEISDEEVEHKSADGNSESSIYSMVSQAVDDAQRRITELINKQVWEKYPEFKDISPKFSKYKFDGKSYNSLTYTKKLDLFDSAICVSTDETGRIINECSSK